TTATAGALAKLCYEILLADGPAAVAAAKTGAVTPALERIVEANTLLSGLGFESGGLAVAHSVHNGLTTVPATHAYLHGEKVAFGLLVQLVVEGRPAAEFAEVVAATRRAGVPLRAIIGLSAFDEELMDQYGPALARTSFFLPHVPFESDVEPLRTYRDAMVRYAPQLGDTEQSIALAGYIHADVLIRGLQEAGPCPTRENFIDRLRAVDDYTSGGLLPNTDFDGDFGRLKECWAVVQIDSAGDGTEVVDLNYCGERLPS
nr:iron-containing alcohol dehydrogenase [Micromonospora sp. DSM 115978]